MKYIYIIIFSSFVFTESFSQKLRGKNVIKYSKEAKQWKKDKWQTTGENFENQIRFFYEVRNKRNEDMMRKFITGIGLFTSNDIGQGRKYARELAKEEIAGKISTQVRSVTKIDQRNDQIAASLNDALSVVNTYIKESLTGSDDAYFRYRENGKKDGQGNPMYDCEVAYFFNYENAAKIHMQMMRDELNRKATKETRDEYEKFLKDGIMEEVNSRIDADEDN
tara:strand:- start:253 stop:918 length:666 start_codon:yes stop_codon:yes gene_type:complete